jgi:chromosome segregation ATPase
MFDPVYLQQAVGSVLSEGLIATAEANPPDPVEFLAKWLLHYRDHQDACAEFKEAYANIEEERAEYLAKLKLEMERLEEERRQREEELRQIEEQKRLAKEAAAARRKGEEESDSEDESKPSARADDASASYSGSGD